MEQLMPPFFALFYTKRDFSSPPTLAGVQNDRGGCAASCLAGLLVLFCELVVLEWAECNLVSKGKVSWSKWLGMHCRPRDFLFLRGRPRDF